MAAVSSVLPSPLAPNWRTSNTFAGAFEAEEVREEQQPARSNSKSPAWATRQKADFQGSRIVWALSAAGCRVSSDLGQGQRAEIRELAAARAPRARPTNE